MFLGLPLSIRVSWHSRFALADLGFALTFYFHFHMKAKKFDWMMRRVGKPYKGVPHCHRARFVPPRQGVIRTLNCPGHSELENQARLCLPLAAISSACAFACSTVWKCSPVPGSDNGSAGKRLTGVPY
jgi:hypothetical protein